MRQFNITLCRARDKEKIAGPRTAARPLFGIMSRTVRIEA
jgi:hypothetical protein